ncbi:CLIP-associating protein 1 [Zootermopsis nevadensis]|uniref:CLIP-associating protein 1 n=1 Tax=Zootermopsis nevadensis TaxID=136037 RepID=A0A067R2S2_ZOONE|nr:CLIP-associating protein 1 [Zootermopsis nevadensis]
MALSPKDMDGFLPLLATADTRTKLTLAMNLINYLGDPDNSIECSDIGQFIDGLIPWMQSSNNKVSQNGIDAMTYLVDRMAVDFRPYISTVLPPIIDRLGDSKEVVREKAQLLILKLMERDVITPSSLFEKLTPAFSHKNGKIREEVMNCLQTTLTEHGARSLSVSRLIPSIVKLLGDPMSTVRDTAFNTLVEVYRHVGDRLRIDLQKKHNLPASKLPALMARFDELRAAGDLLPSASVADGGRGDDEVEGIVKSATKRANSVPRRGIFSAIKSVPSTPAPPGTGSKIQRTSSLRRPTPSAGGQAGAVDEETFSRAFEDVPTIQLFSARDLEKQLTVIRETIADPNKDWSKRVDALKKVRSLVIAGASSFDEFYAHLKLLEPSFQTSVKDLRSQVVREACYTIAFLSEQLGPRCDHFAEDLLNSLISLIQNSAKIMASAGVVTVRFIIRYTHSPRLIPIIAQNLNSKSKDIRRACCEFLEQLLHSWSTHSLERHIALLQDAIKKGIADADPEARLCARQAYWSFRSHFPEQADSLLNSLDIQYKRALNGDLTLSNSSSTNSLHHQGGGSTVSRYGSGGTTPRVRLPSSATGSTENLHQQSQYHSGLHRTPSLTRHHRSGIPVLAAAASGPKSVGAALRSNSAIDLQAAQRAKARAQYAALARHKVGSGASLPRPRKTPEVSGGMTISAITSPERVGRTRSRVAGVSQSQPSSRSGSPSSRLSYATYSTASREGSTGDGVHSVGRPRRLSSGIPRSTGASRDGSRETSPNRFGMTGIHDRSFGSKLWGRPVHSMSSERPPQRPVMAQKILQQSREAESALADALSFDTMDSGDFGRNIPNSRKSYRPFDDHSDDSETSSVCSERSFESYRRTSDSYSWSGSQQRLYRDMLESVSKDITDIIGNCASTHWADRKEGLVGLQNYFQNGNALTGSELKRVTDIFTKMFMDSHTKVFSLFLDTLNELILTHKADMNDWLYVLLTRLVNKLGGDLLGSIQNKIHKSLSVVRDLAPCKLQMNAVMRFLVDGTQTPNSKVKVAILTFLTQLATCMEASAFGPVIISGRDCTPVALSKIIGWTSDAKSSEIRRAAQAAVIALFNLNTPQFTMILAGLPTDYQEAAATLVHSHLRRSSSGSGSSPPSPSVPSSHVTSSPRLQSPGCTTPQQLQPRGSLRGNSIGNLDDDNLNPEEVYRSLRRTTAEIQNYSFEALGSGKLLDRDRDTTSQDSGISQMSAGAGDKMDTLEEHMEDVSVTRDNSGRSSSLSSPTHRLNSLRDYNGIEKSMAEISLDGDNGFIPHESHHQEESEEVRKVIDALRVAEQSGGSPGCEGTEAERKAVLMQLIRLIRECSTLVVMENFKTLLRVLLDQLTKPEGSVRALALTVLAEMLKKPSIGACFHNYTELLLLKVLQSHKDSSKEVLRSAEACAATMGTVLPPDVVIRVLNPLITTGEYPVNQGAIKMLTKLVEQKSKEVMEPHLADIMPGLIKAYDNEDSSVRKSAVFCMVALHSIVGEDALQPHLEALNGSKLKLLHLYIRRAQQGSSVPTSPKNAPP